MSYESRFADLFYEVIAQRYEQHATLVSTNRPFREWNEVFPTAAVVAIVERLTHRSEVIQIQGNSFRAFEAEQQAGVRAELRAGRRR